MRRKAFAATIAIVGLSVTLLLQAAANDGSVLGNKTDPGRHITILAHTIDGG